MTTIPDPSDNDCVLRRCPNCRNDVWYFCMAWHIVRSRFGELIRRRMGPCPHCGAWIKPVLVMDEGHGVRGWIIECVDPFEVSQVTKTK